MREIYEATIKHLKDEVDLYTGLSERTESPELDRWIRAREIHELALSAVKRDYAIFMEIMHGLKTAGK